MPLRRVPLLALLFTSSTAVSAVAADWVVPLRIQAAAAPFDMHASVRGEHVALIERADGHTLVSIRDPDSGADSGRFVIDAPALAVSHGTDGSVFVLADGEPPTVSRIAPDGTHGWTEPAPGAHASTIVAGGTDGAFLIDYRGSMTRVEASGAVWHRDLDAGFDSVDSLAQISLDAGDLVVVARGWTAAQGSELVMARFARESGDTVWIIDGLPVNDPSIMEFDEIGGSIRVIVSDASGEPDRTTILLAEASTGALTRHELATSAGECEALDQTRSFANMDVLRVCAGSTGARIERIARADGAVVWAHEHPGTPGAPAIDESDSVLVPINANDATSAVALILDGSGEPVLELPIPFDETGWLDSITPLPAGEFLLQIEGTREAGARTERRTRAGTELWHVDRVAFDGLNFGYSASGAEGIFAASAIDQGERAQVHVVEVDRATGAISLDRTVPAAPGTEIEYWAAVSPEPASAIVAAQVRNIDSGGRCGFMQRVGSAPGAAAWTRGCDAFPRDFVDSLVRTSSGGVFLALRREPTPGAIQAHRIERIDPATGTAMWGIAVPTRPRFLLARGEGLYEVETLSFDEHRIVRRDASTGEPMWTRTLRTRSARSIQLATSPTDDLVVAHVGIPGPAPVREVMIARLDALTGSERWLRAFGELPDVVDERTESLLVAADGTIFLSTTRMPDTIHVRRLDPADGSLVWRYGAPHPGWSQARGLQLREAPDGTVAFVRERFRFGMAGGFTDFVASTVARLDRADGTLLGDHALADAHGDLTQDAGPRAPSYFVGDLGTHVVTTERMLDVGRASFGGGGRLVSRKWPSGAVAGNVRVRVSLVPVAETQLVAETRVDYAGDPLPGPVLVTMHIDGPLGAVSWTCRIEGSGACGRLDGEGFDATIPLELSPGDTAVVAAVYDHVDRDGTPAVRASASPPFELGEIDSADNYAETVRGDAIFADGMELLAGELGPGQ